jgi:DNA-binding LytR/AlgR family response regulator
MSKPAAPTALIAEDEPLLAAALQAELARAWPELKVLAVVGDGGSAVTQALRLKPDVLFFDIRMPGQSGLEAAAELADEWDTGADGSGGTPFPALVFVTAYDQYAVQAFETQAMDYVLKPIQAARLQKTVSKVQLALASRSQAATETCNCRHGRCPSGSHHGPAAPVAHGIPVRCAIPCSAAQGHSGECGHGHSHGAGGRHCLL